MKKKQAIALLVIVTVLMMIITSCGGRQKPFVQLIQMSEPTLTIDVETEARRIMNTFSASVSVDTAAATEILWRVQYNEKEGTVTLALDDEQKSILNGTAAATDILIEGNHEKINLILTAQIVGMPSQKASKSLEKTICLTDNYVRGQIRTANATEGYISLGEKEATYKGECIPCIEITRFQKTSGDYIDTVVKNINQADSVIKDLLTDMEQYRIKTYNTDNIPIKIIELNDGLINRGIRTYYMLIGKTTNENITEAYKTAMAYIVTKEENQISTITIEASPTEGGDISFDNHTWTDNASRTKSQGSTVTLYASPTTDYAFDGWYENGTKITDANPYTFILNTNRTLTAHFTEIPNIPPTIEKDSGASGNITTNTSTFSWRGTDSDGSIDHYEYKKDDGNWTTTGETQHTWSQYTEGSHTFSVKAVDNDGDESETITWTFNYSIPVPTHSITITANPAAGGDVSFNNASWKDTDTKTVNQGSGVNTYARTATNYTFDGWYENNTKLSDANPYTITLNTNRTIEARFEENAPVHTLPDMVLLNAGSFQMGDTRDEGYGDEKPVHTVTLTYNYEIGKYEVTNAQFLEFLNDAGVSADGQLNGHEVLDMDDTDCEFEYNGTAFVLKQAGKGNYPVIEVSWWGAIEYCNWLSGKEGVSAAYDTGNGSLLNNAGNNTTDITAVRGYRIPTEAEWEYAARGGHHDITSGTEANDYAYAGSDTIGDVAWYWENSQNATYPIYEGKGTHEVGTKAANEAGIRDMSGNVWEWCQDWYASDYYASSPSQNPVNLTSSSGRVFRGGSWVNIAILCRVANRDLGTPGSSYGFLGFRLARTR